MKILPQKKWTSYTWEDPVTVSSDRASFFSVLVKTIAAGSNFNINLNETAVEMKRFDTRTFGMIRFDPKATTAFRETMVVN